MDYENIIEIVELDYDYDVNKYLKCGWVLLSVSVGVAPGCRGIEKGRIYSLGWNKKNGAVQYPISEKSKKLNDAIIKMLNGDDSEAKEFLDEWNAGD